MSRVKEGSVVTPVTYGYNLFGGSEHICACFGSVNPVVEKLNNSQLKTYLSEAFREHSVSFSKSKSTFTCQSFSFSVFRSFGGHYRGCYE